jgi:hypothetical protein
MVEDDLVVDNVGGAGLGLGVGGGGGCRRVV